jgi:hypothetical protein
MRRGAPAAHGIALHGSPEAVLLSYLFHMYSMVTCTI